MIISNISGGLGNQLFQYAAGRSLALHHNTELRLDISSFQNAGLRNFELTNFSIQAAIATPDQIKGFTSRSFTAKTRDRLLPVQFKKLYKEPFFHYDKNFFRTSSSVYLKGYWQSEKYFSGIKDVLKKDFKLHPALTKDSEHYAAELRSVASVSVHIRRADYAASVFKEYHGILDIAYYKRAINLLKEKKQYLQFYFFSDDMNWVKENFRLPGAVYVSGEMTKTHIEDLYLMSQCRHNIIANSSFSWWGAWLNDNPDKIVVAPKNWFNKGPKDTYDLYPDSWIKL